MKVFWDENGERIYFGPGQSKPETEVGAPQQSQGKPTQTVAQHDPRLLAVIRYQFFYSLLGFIVGLACVMGGMVLFFSGIAGAVDWSIKIGNAESTLANGSPGIVLFIVGLFIVWISRFSVKFKK